MALRRVIVSALVLLRASRRIAIAAGSLDRRLRHRKRDTDPLLAYRGRETRARPCARIL